MVVEEYLKFMAVDKKVKEGKMRFVLLRKIGEAIVTGDVSRDQIAATLRACTA